jgi:hypothetical protein
MPYQRKHSRPFKVVPYSIIAFFMGFQEDSPNLLIPKNSASRIYRAIPIIFLPFHDWFSIYPLFYSISAALWIGNLYLLFW